MQEVGSVKSVLRKAKKSIVGLTQSDSTFKEPGTTMPAQTKAALKAAYENAQVILEYGSGASTLMAARLSHSPRVFAVETSEAFTLGMEGLLKKGGFSEKVLMHWANIGPTKGPGRPVSEGPWRRFLNYPFSVWQLPEFQHPEVILIDGRFRPGVFVACAQLITKPVTVLFDDYEMREPYHVVEQIAKPVRMHGRMAEFHLTPRPKSSADLFLLMRTMGRIL
jgi:hypothetical protein